MANAIQLLTEDRIAAKMWTVFKMEKGRSPQQFFASSSRCEAAYNFGSLGFHYGDSR
jgi:hypothetical protein